MTDLVDFEIDALRLLAGRPQTRITGWGAGLGVAIEGLRGRRLARQEPCEGGYRWVATDAGIALLDSLEPKP